MSFVGLFICLSGLYIEKHEEFTIMVVSNTRIQHMIFTKHVAGRRDKGEFLKTAFT